jgi:hypothetical protein
MNPKRFLVELKRRNVYRAAVLHGMSGWLIAQMTSHAVVAVDCRFEIAQGELTQIETCSLPIMGETRGLSRLIKR